MKIRLTKSIQLVGVSYRLAGVFELPYTAYTQSFLDN